MKFEFSQDELERMQTSKWLTIRERKVFQRFYIDGVFIEDIAAELEVCRRTVINDLRSIRRKALY